jgi:hypothetical protein
VEKKERDRINQGRTREKKRKKTSHIRYYCNCYCGWCFKRHAFVIKDTTARREYIDIEKKCGTTTTLLFSSRFVVVVVVVVVVVIVVVVATRLIDVERLP